MHIINIDSLPDTAQLTIAELETSQAKGRRGITRLSSSQIRRLEDNSRNHAKSLARAAAFM